MPEKEITLEYNGYNIKIQITDNYEETQKIIMQKVYLQEKDLNKYSLYYHDEENDICDVEEDQFDDAYNSDNWVLKKLGEEEDGEEEKPKVDLTSYKDQIKENAQKDVDTKISKIKNDLIEKFKEITKKKISDCTAKYEKKIKKLEEIIKSLKEKNQENMKIMEKANEESVRKILESVSQYTESKIGSQMDEYNNELTKNVDSQLKLYNEKAVKINDEAKIKINELNNQKESMRNSISNAKGIFCEIYKMSIAKIGNQQK